MAPSRGVKLTPSVSAPLVWNEKEIRGGLLVEFTESLALTPIGLMIANAALEVMNPEYTSFAPA